MSAITQRLYIIDGNSLLHRAWHAIPPLTTQDGLVVNAAYGFAMVLDKLIQEQQPTHLAVCWDVKGGTFRDEVFEDYKAGREQKEQELYDQIDLINSILDAYGIPSFGIEGWEADDLIGTIAEIERKNDATDTIIITGDLDALQLVDDSTEVHFFVKGLSKMKVYDTEAVIDRYEFGPEHIVDYKALAGDSSDNIPGVKGVGAKTATTLIKAFGGVEDIYAAAEDGRAEGVVSDGMIKKLLADKDNAMMSLKLAKIVRDVEIDFSMDDAKIEGQDWDKIKQLFREFEFTNLLRRLETRGDIESYESAEDTPKETSSCKVAVDTDGSHVKALLDLCKDDEAIYGLEIATHAQDLFGSSVTALAIATQDEAIVFRSPTADTLEQLKPTLTSRRFATHDLKRLFALLESEGVTLSSEGIDLMVASYLVNVGDRNYSIDSILSSVLGATVPDLPTEFGTDAAFEQFGQVVAHYPQVASALQDQLDEQGMHALYADIEHPLIRVLYEMERDGITVDISVLKEMSKRMEQDIESLTKRIWKLAGTEFNVNSPSQLADVLFVDLMLPTKGIKKTKTGYSTAASELEKIWDAHEMVPLISQYRELTKLKSTYVDALPELVASDGRIHTSFNQTVAATGRLSSSDPNLQNIPIRTEQGREIRKAFVAPKGKTLIAIDYSQIELRLVAAFSEDKKMIKVFTSGGDIHRSTAAEVFDVPEDEVTKDQRRAAKAVNFGIIYGMGPRALSRNIDVSFQEAKDFIERYFAVYPTVRAYLDRSLETAKENEYAETMFGRRRALPELSTGVPMLRAAAERMATNMPLQGAAADIIKMAMVEAQNWLHAQAYGDDARMLLQVHDELVFEVKNELVDTIAAKMKEIMEGVAALPVPLTADVEVGQNWKELKKWQSS